MATPHDQLIAELLDSRIPKTEREHAAAREIKRLREALAEPEKANQCGETCERAKLCAVCANGLAEPEFWPGDVLICKEDFTKVTVAHGNRGSLQLMNGKIAIAWNDGVFGEYTIEQVKEMFYQSETPEPKPWTPDDMAYRPGGLPMDETKPVSHHSEDDLDMVKVLDEKTCQKEKQIAWKQCAANIDKFNGNPQFAFSMGFYAGISASKNAKHPPSRPVAYLDMSNDLSYSMRELAEEDVYLDTETMVPLYTAPPARKPLTDTEMRQCANAMDAEPLSEGWKELIKFARAIERAHGIGSD